MHNVSLQINEFVERASRMQFTRQDWIMISVVVLGLGFLCLKGLGNRNKF